MSGQDTFLGEPFAFWIELKRKGSDLNVTHLIREIAELSAKVSYYERKLDEMETFRVGMSKP